MAYGCFIPLGKSCGLTSSLKKACASWNLSSGGTCGLNQNLSALDSRVWEPVAADTRNTQNSNWAWHGSVTPFSEIHQFKWFSMTPFSDIRWFLWFSVTPPVLKCIFMILKDAFFWNSLFFYSMKRHFLKIVVFYIMVTSFSKNNFVLDSVFWNSLFFMILCDVVCWIYFIFMILSDIIT